MNMMATTAEEFRENTREQTKKVQPSVIDRMTHDIVNQLSVISLCCCELRNSFAEKLESDQLNEFMKVETAVQAAAEMIQQLKAIIRLDSAGLSSRVGG